MNQADFEFLANEATRRPLTPDERVQLASWLVLHPEAEEDLALSRALRAAPSPKVSSNFTSRVLQEVEREQRRASRDSAWLKPSWWLPRFAAAAACLAMVGLILTRQHQQAERAQWVESLSALKETANVLESPANGQPSAVVDVLKDFEAIRRINTGRDDVDVSLLAALARD